MALEKIDVLALGRGNLTDNSNAAIGFSSNSPVDLWSAGPTYAQYNVVEYSGRVYRSKVAGNTANQPDISPNQWETLYIGVKDGDFAYVVNGANSAVQQRVAGAWTVLGDAPITVSLVDGQASPAPAVVYIGSTKAFGKFEYTLRRGSGQGRKRKGLMNILNDTLTVAEYDHTFNEIGTDVNSWLTIDILAGNVRVMYTSGLEGVALELKYSLKGWT